MNNKVTEVQYEMSIGEMTLEDCMGVYPLICELASGGIDGSGSTYRPPVEGYQQAFKDILEDRQKQYYVAKQAGEIVGVIGLTLNKVLVEAGHYAVIDELVVGTKYRRRGIAQMLLDEGIAFAKSNRCFTVCLMSGSKRLDAHKLYEKNGFKNVGAKFEKMLG